MKPGYYDVYDKVTIAWVGCVRAHSTQDACHKAGLKFGYAKEMLAAEFREQ